MTAPTACLAEPVGSYFRYLPAMNARATTTFPTVPLVRTLLQDAVPRA